MVATLLAVLSIAQEPFALKDGDKVLFYGDSITEQRLYTNYVETFVRTRYPKLKVEFVNAGVGGDCTWGGWTGSPEERIKRDVKPENPTVITIMLGMNDGGYVPFDPKIFAIFQEWYGKLLDLIKKETPKARVTLMNSSPYDDWGHPDTDFKGYSQTVKRFGEYVPQLAKERGLGFVEINAPLTAFIQDEVGRDAKRAMQIAPDAIHPGPSGHFLIAHQLLQSWGASRVVSFVELDIKAGKVLRSDNAKVEKLSGLTWTQTDGSLPYPVGADVAMASEYVGFQDVWNMQVLKITGLEAGKYQLVIDGEKIGEASDRWREIGVNLAPLKTPMRAQAEKVMELTIKRNEAAFTKSRGVEFSLKGYPSTSAASKVLGSLVKEIGAELRKAAQPKPHRFELVRVGTRVPPPLRKPSV